MDPLPTPSSDPRQLLRRVGSERGFSLIELLVVMVIVGLLAAIAIPVFLGQDNKGRDASAKSLARNAVTAVESCFIDEGDYRNCNDAGDGSMADANLDWSKLTVSAPGPSGALYSVAASSPLGHSFTIVRGASGDWSRSCEPAGAGGCHAGGSW